MCDFNKQKTIKPEKEGEEKVKKPRFPNILVPPRRLSRVDSTSGEYKTTVKPFFKFYYFKTLHIIHI